MSDYTRQRANALDSIDRKGRIVTLVKTGDPAFNPLNSTVTPVTPVNTTRKAVFTNYTSRDIDGEIIKLGDKKCLIAGAVDADALIDGTVRYEIINNVTVDPGDGGVILSKLQVRK